MHVWNVRTVADFLQAPAGFPELLKKDRQSLESMETEQSRC